MSTLVVTNLSLGVGGLPDGSVTTSDLADGAVTTAKIAAGAVATADIADAAVTAAKLDGAQSGSAPIFGARAWVSFDGTRNAAGTVNTSNTTRQIRASGNVTSVLKNGTGDYTITFTTAMPDSNFCVSGAASRSGAGTRGTALELHPTTAKTTTTVTVRTVTIDTGPTPIDCGPIDVCIFR